MPVTLRAGSASIIAEASRINTARRCHFTRAQEVRRHHSINIAYALMPSHSITSATESGETPPDAHNVMLLRPVTAASLPAAPAML